jgi:hypothetical protein
MTVRRWKSAQKMAVQRSPSALLAEVTTPTLVLHARDDARVPFDQGTARGRYPGCPVRIAGEPQPPDP